MLVYTIFVTTSLFDLQNSKSALSFSKSIMKNTNHSINSIFFYSSGIFNSIQTIENKINQVNLVDCWYNFSKVFSINLYVCSTAARDRGIITEYIEKKFGFKNKNLHFGFKLVGLGKLVYSILHADRLLQF